MKSKIGKVIRVIFSLVIIAWLAVVLVDYFNTKNNRSAKFCLSHEDKTYDTYEVHICHGLGYNVFHYDFEGGYIIDFSPFWKQERTSFDE